MSPRSERPSSGSPPRAARRSVSRALALLCALSLSLAPALSNAQGGAPPPASQSREVPPPASTRWLPWTLFGLSAAATASTVVAFAERERLAARWNSAACIAPGRTRGEVCGDEHDTLGTWDGVLIASGIAAGAFLGATLFVLGAEPSRSADDAGRLSASCGLGLAAVSCSGRF